jgi:hypothetical protein
MGDAIESAWRSTPSGRRHRGSHLSRVSRVSLALLAIGASVAASCRATSGTPSPDLVDARDSVVAVVELWSEVPRLIALLSADLRLGLDSAAQARVVAEMQSLRAEGEGFGPPRPSIRRVDLRSSGGPRAQAAGDLTLHATARAQFLRDDVELRFSSRSPAALALVREALRRTFLASLDTLGPVRLSVETAFGAPGEPMRTALGIVTVREYGCLGYALAARTAMEGHTIALHLDGVLPPRGLCPTAVGPATRSWPLPAASGTYEVAISYAGDTARFVLVRTDSSVQLSTRRSTALLAAIDERLHWLLDERSFVLACGPARSPSRMCAELHDWVAGTSGIERPVRVADGVHPAIPRGFNDTTNLTVVYRHRDEAALRAVLECVSSIRPFFAETRGTRLRLRTWRGVGIAASTEGQWGRVLDPPSVLGHTSACGV